MKIKKPFLILFFALFLVLPLHSQSQSQSISQSLDEQILNLSNFQIDYLNQSEDLLTLQLKLQLAESQSQNAENLLNESQKQLEQATELSQTLSIALNESETKCRLWKNAFLISTTVAIITTGTTAVLIYLLNK